MPATLTLAQVFSFEFCEIFNNTFFHRTPPVAASGPYDLNAYFINLGACFCLFLGEKNLRKRKDIGD